MVNLGWVKLRKGGRVSTGLRIGPRRVRAHRVARNRKKNAWKYVKTFDVVKSNMFENIFK